MLSIPGDVQSDLSVIIEKLLSNGVKRTEVEGKYILPLSERPQLSEVSYSESIPVVDLQDLDGPNRRRVVHEIQHALGEDGCFQIVNHGVPAIVMKIMMEIAKEFFEMPVEDRACLYSEDPKQSVRLYTTFSVGKEKVFHWREGLMQPCHPLEEVMNSWPEKPAAYSVGKEKVFHWREGLMQPCHPLEEVMNSWPEKPAAYREIAARYSMAVRALILRLLAAISEALGLDSHYLNTSFGKHGQNMLTNYYPPCPNPDLTLGSPSHSDPSGITVLMQGDVNGLQVLKNGKWVAVQPITNAFVINLGDLLQVVSNGRFRSVQHRAITNASTTRISIATFSGPSPDAFVAPAASLVDEQHPALYRGYEFGEFMRVLWRIRGLKGKTVLDHFKMEYPEDNNGE